MPDVDPRRTRSTTKESGSPSSFFVPLRVLRGRTRDQSSSVACNLPDLPCKMHDGLVRASAIRRMDSLPKSLVVENLRPTHSPCRAMVWRMRFLLRAYGDRHEYPPHRR